MKRFGQGGFATLEMILMVAVIGILSAIAVPRFDDVVTRANTARIQSDLTNIDTAIALYEMDKEKKDSLTLDDLKEYLTDATKIKPPTFGNYYVLKADSSESEVKPITAKAYTIGKPTGAAEGDNTLRAMYDGHTIGDFGYKPKNE